MLTAFTNFKINDDYDQQNVADQEFPNPYHSKQISNQISLEYQM